MEMQLENAISGNVRGPHPKSLFGYEVIDYIGEGAGEPDLRRQPPATPSSSTP